MNIVLTLVVGLTALEWTLVFTLGAIYFVLMFTLAVITWRKGRKALAIIGIILPLLWIIGAMLPTKEGVHYKGPMDYH